MKTRLNNAVTTLVGSDARITGNLIFGRGCHVAGLVQGDVLAAGDGNNQLTVASDARIEGNARAAGMQIQGTVVGDLCCSGTVSLSASARVEGSIEYGHIEVEKGAVVTGSLNRKAEKEAENAPVAAVPAAEPEHGKPVRAAAG